MLHKIAEGNTPLLHHPAIQPNYSDSNTHLLQQTIVYPQVQSLFSTTHTKSDRCYPPRKVQRSGTKSARRRPEPRTFLVRYCRPRPGVRPWDGKKSERKKAMDGVATTTAGSGGRRCMRGSHENESSQPSYQWREHDDVRELDRFLGRPERDRSLERSTLRANRPPRRSGILSVPCACASSFEAGGGVST